MAERGTEVENGWVRSTHFSSVCGAVVDGRSSHPRQPVRPLAVGLSHVFDPLVATYQAYLFSLVCGLATPRQYCCNGNCEIFVAAETFGLTIDVIRNGGKR